ARYITGPGFNVGDRLDAVVVGYVLWTLVLYIINDIAIGLQSEAQTGTLEQVFLSPFGAPRVFLARAVASLALRLTLIVVIVVILMAITGSQLSFPPTLIFPLISLLTAGYGLAFAMGACALVFKRVQQVLGVFQFLLLFLLAAPVEEWQGALSWLRYLLPMLPSTGLLRDVMARDIGLNWGLWGLALANGLGYLALGLALFVWAERTAKRQGLLGGY
ncbi:MAG: ABC transporter permease, partial [Cyanobacteria bacterium]|nr:ABC transporter permease [Cyanobacteriota bacterium]